MSISLTYADSPDTTTPLLAALRDLAEAAGDACRCDLRGHLAGDHKVRPVDRGAP
ncbi:hypothetical protein HC028_20685 [Planosporangium flavigriseum]|nr:hypothetical protein [Planosporangium flavigriseum]NJC66905.1 hypothetical protein [Planosporangium flavigriseum]